MIIKESLLREMVNKCVKRVLSEMDDIDKEFAEKFKAYWNSDEFKQSQAIHLADADTKKQSMQGYLDSRSANLGKKLGNMSQAEWNALRSTSENIKR